MDTAKKAVFFAFYGIFVLFSSLFFLSRKQSKKRLEGK